MTKLDSIVQILLQDFEHWILCDQVVLQVVLESVEFVKWVERGKILLVL